ncbi:hypothetical protein Xmau_04296 [Xenorhabdus mauleonii]|uniref:Sel1 repeat-containing protein n=1 Tax=Xenorhabdus mauleonii TaxID=351675 RepID=A0A1I3XSF8_9GAMM|nr:sel1 repeat family protein [Xenorhabdus mauleonii]PHM36287.1 hypothetical protein Xmau_04296 [Xenorhabdus mauleonii]SFK22468.1 hypothetical protein SAMN05421680_13814 [Xenorhabdus mauleonii]
MKNKKKILSLILFFSFITYGCSINDHNTPSIVFNHSDNFLSALPIPVPKNEHEYHELVNKANEGDAEANWMLAVILQTEKRYRGAMKRYQLSISRNDKYKLKSMVNLGFVLQSEHNYAKAREFFELAGKSGEFGGYRALGVNYLNGIGVKQHINKAKEYFEKGSQIGCHECAYYVEHWNDVVKLKQLERLELSGK